MKRMMPNYVQDRPTHDRPTQESGLARPQLAKRGTEESRRTTASVNGPGEITNRASRRRRPRKLIVTDGPFAESKELLGSSSQVKGRIPTAEELASAIAYLL